MAGHEAPMRCLHTITDRDVLGREGLSDAPRREAVRAVLRDAQGLIALLYVGRWGAYTLPGGGIEPGEAIEEALLREVREEAGCDSRILCPLGYVDENRAADDFTQRSYGYLAEVVGQKGVPDMTDEEIEEDTQVQWHPLEQAIQLIEDFHASHSRTEFWRRRELAFLRAVKQDTHPL